MRFLIPAEKGAVDDVCEVEQFLVPEMLYALESEVFCGVFTRSDCNCIMNINKSRFVVLRR